MGSTGRSWSVLALLAAASGCVGPLAFVPRHPWVEERSLELAEEDLRLEVGATEIAVDALFVFRPHGAPRDRWMTFPVAAPGGPAGGFTATIEAPGVAPHRLVTMRGEPGLLPTGMRVDETWEIAVPAAAVGRGRRLRVRYRQRTGCRVSYVLRTGAYWRGAMRRLDVTIVDVAGLVRAARVEGVPPHERRGRVLRWSFRDVEPAGGVALRTASPRCSPARS